MIKKETITGQSNEKFIPFTDDFAFSLVMRNPELCRKFLNLILPEADIGEVRVAESDNDPLDENEKIDVTTQASMKFVEGMHGVRFDAYIKSQNLWAAIEMQTTSNESLGKRARYYRCSMDYDCLEEGDDYEKLKTTYVIFICTFDYLKEDRPIYFFRSWDVENNLPLNDFTFTILLNAKCSPEKVPENLRELYEYINDPSNVGESELIRDIDRRVKKFNRSDWRIIQMTYGYYLKEAEKKGRNEGLEQGRSEGLEQGIAQGRTEGEASGRAERELEMAKAMKAKDYSIEEISELTGLTVDEIDKL